MSKFIEISHEIRNPYSFLSYSPPKPSKEISEIIRCLESDGCFALPWFIFVICESVGVILGEIESDLAIPVNVSDELVVIDLVKVAFVHIFFEE